MDEKDTEMACLLRLEAVARNYVKHAEINSTSSAYVPENGLFGFQSPWSELVDAVAFRGPPVGGRPWTRPVGR